MTNRPMRVPASTAMRLTSRGAPLGLPSTCPIDARQPHIDRRRRALARAASRPPWQYRLTNAAQVPQNGQTFRLDPAARGMVVSKGGRKRDKRYCSVLAVSRQGLPVRGREAMNIIKRPHGTAAPGRRGPPKLAEGEREHLKAEVVYWGLQQAQQGRLLSEDELQQEYDGRLIEAEKWLRDSSNELRQEYDRRRRQADDWLRDSREKQQQQQGEPPPAGAPSPAPEAKATRLFTR